MLEREEGFFLMLCKKEHSRSRFQTTWEYNSNILPFLSQGLYDNLSDCSKHPLLVGLHIPSLIERTHPMGHVNCTEYTQTLACITTIQTHTHKTKQKQNNNNNNNNKGEIYLVKGFSHKIVKLAVNISSVVSWCGQTLAKAEPAQGYTESSLRQNLPRDTLSPP